MKKSLNGWTVERDLTFEETPVNEVDNLIFCLLSYVDLDGIVPDGIVPEDPKKGLYVPEPPSLHWEDICKFFYIPK